MVAQAAVSARLDIDIVAQLDIDIVVQVIVEQETVGQHTVALRIAVLDIEGSNIVVLLDIDTAVRGIDTAEQDIGIVV